MTNQWQGLWQCKMHKTMAKIMTITTQRKQENMAKNDGKSMGKTMAGQAGQGGSVSV